MVANLDHDSRDQSAHESFTSEHSYHFVEDSSRMLAMHDSVTPLTAVLSSDAEGVEEGYYDGHNHAQPAATATTTASAGVENAHN